MLIEEGCLADDTFDISHDRTMGGVLLWLSTLSRLLLQSSQESIRIPFSSRINFYIIRIGPTVFRANLKRVNY